ncbi:family 20 glycosylhydrolase [Bacteroides sp.]|uniref:glycoside hydrolase family 20 protein n=1 Tax=Bacteroides sp. TaxID=29523 RepID=UPI00284B239B|nr:family 20 glycosylhydrolase [Bacteroides sp.]MDR3952391.1 family 20 glycosylhydrolase [Bacteroides sp.]
MACGTQDIQTGNLNVIPLPQEIVETPSAAPFVINSSTTICYEEGNEKLAGTARMLAGYIKEVTGTEVKIGTKAGKNCIILKVDPSITHKEGYELNVSVDVITLTGATEAGVFYGCQTIHKALPITDGKALASLPAGTVKDFPQYNYRGFMIDVGRHFFPKEYLKELIDVMALHNINYFHWHLTEDQGWRIEIKKYPKLTEVGSYRKETITAPGSGKFDGTPVSGYYTQEDAKEIVAYAAERFITVIPEIDMPGHMLAALASYPELGCTGGPYETATKFGVFKEVLCGGNPQTLQFAKDVVNELMDIFPDAPYIHIGGDECPKAEWMKCPKCQAKIKELGLHDTEEHSKENQLQVYFMNEVEKEILKCEPDEKYTYQGANLLVDGLQGDDNYRSGRYIGLYGQNFDAIIDLQETKEISSVSLGTYLVPGDYIFGLTGLEIYGSNDGSAYSKIASKTIPVLEKGSKNNVLKRDTVSFGKTKARYVRIIGKNTPVLPKWHPGAGKRTYLFLDEITID